MKKTIIALLASFIIGVPVATIGVIHYTSEGFQTNADFTNGNIESSDFTEVVPEETIKLSFADITFTESNIADAMYSAKSSSDRTYSPDLEGESYLYWTGTITNTGKVSYSVSDMVAEIEIDGKRYLAWIKDDFDSWNDSVAYTKYLGTTTFYIGASIPDEVLTNCTNCTLYIGFKPNFEDLYYGGFESCEYLYKMKK